MQHGSKDNAGCEDQRQAAMLAQAGHELVDDEWIGMTQPRRAASIAAMSIFFIVIIASNARLATAGSGFVIACVKATGVICQDKPHLSLHQPHWLSWPPLPMMAFQ